MVHSISRCVYPEKVFNKGYLECYTGDLRYYMGMEDWNDSSWWYHGMGRCWDRNSDARKKLTDHRSFYWWTPPFTDGTLGTTVELATQNLLQAILPAGTNSISVDVFFETKAAGNASTKSDDLSKTATDQLRVFLNRNDKHFEETLLDLTRDFSLYGNSIAVQMPDKNKRGVYTLMHLPFHETYFGSSGDTDEISWVYSRCRTHTIDGMIERELKLVLVDGKWYLKRVITDPQGQEELTTHVYPEGVTAALVAREPLYTNTPYGWGSGFVALPHVKDLNWASSAYKNAVEKMVVPPAVLDSRVKTFSTAFGHNTMDLSPGGVVLLSIPEGTQTTPADNMTLVKPSDLDLQAVATFIKERTKQVQSSFFVDPVFGVAAQGQVGNTTATEILERKAQSLVLYRGKSTALAEGILTPYFREVLENTKLSRMRGVTFEISYFSAEKRRAKQANQEALAQQFSVLTNLGQQVDQEDIDRFKEESEEALQ